MMVGATTRAINTFTSGQYPPGYGTMDTWRTLHTYPPGEPHAPRDGSAAARSARYAHLERRVRRKLGLGVGAKVVKVLGPSNAPAAPAAPAACAKTEGVEPVSQCTRREPEAKPVRRRARSALNPRTPTYSM